MFNTIYREYGSNCEILTGVPDQKWKIESAACDKVKWVRKILGDSIVVHTVPSSDKWRFCTGDDSILIDDSEENISQWRDAGGVGILFTSPDNVLIELGFRNRCTQP